MNAKSMKRIEDYALISNCKTAALIHRSGSIDWLCLPHYDSDACFASLMGDRENGFWSICPEAKDVKVSRKYRNQTMILETTFTTSEGVVLVTDFLVMGEGPINLVRRVTGISGSVRMRMEFVPRFEYGSRLPSIKQKGSGELKIISGPDQVILRSNRELNLEGEFKAYSIFQTEKDKVVDFQMSWSPSHEEKGAPLNCREAEKATEEKWISWINWCDIKKNYHYPDIIIRSVLTLKAMTFGPTGSILAAVTTSLPEIIGGNRNWDYRFCWPRDAALAIRSVLNVTGQSHEIDAWRKWILRACSGQPSQIEVLYKLDGHRSESEQIIPWLNGFENSPPVRKGNNAHDQLQLDIYGSIIEVFYLAQHMGLTELQDSWDLARGVLKHLEEIWQLPDEGIWEVRGPKRHFTHGKLMVWSAFNWCIKAAEEFGIQGDVEHWRKMRQTIHDDICAHGYNSELNSFTQFYGSTEVDASLLLLPLLDFLPIDDPRFKGTLKKIEEDLLLDEGLIMRYRPNPEVEGLADEGSRAFILCCGWLGQVYAKAGDLKNAIKVYEKLISLCNDVGLLSEQYDPHDKRLFGNFPQAFSHIALINLELAIHECKTQKSDSDHTL